MIYFYSSKNVAVLEHEDIHAVEPKRLGNTVRCCKKYCNVYTVNTDEKK